MSDAPLKIGQAELFAPQVEEYLQVRELIARGVADVPRPSLLARVFYSTWFYLSLAGGMGAFVAWCIHEPYFEDADIFDDQLNLINLLFFPTVVGCIGLFVGAADGLVSRNFRRALICAVVGLGIGALGGLISIFAGGLVFVIALTIAKSMSSTPVDNGLNADGMGFLARMIGRGATWAIASIPAGVGQGIALREKKVALNGFLGAVLGGLLGGLLFDPVCHVVSERFQGSLSRAVSFTIIGLMVGLFIGLVEQWTKTAWLHMRAGPLAGKQFVIYRNPTVLGSSPKADIYLFKDEAIEPRHALIHDHGGRYTLEDLNSPDGTYVNGIPIKKHVLQSGDQIVLGKTVLEFALKDRQ